MSKCKWCNKKGFFLQLTENGLCENCNPKVVNDILDSGTKLKDSIKELNYYIFPQDGLQLIQTIRTSLSILKRYEIKNIPTIEPSASDLFNRNIYGRKDESLCDLENRLKQESIELENGILKVSEIYISGSNVRPFKGIFIFDNLLNTYIQKIEETYIDRPDWTQYANISLEFSDNHKKGIYREYYKSGKLRRETPFIIEKDSDNFYADGVERLYYEDIDYFGKEIYTILGENYYEKGERCGIWKIFSIEGGLIEEINNDKTLYQDNSRSYSFNIKRYYSDLGKLKEENYKDWGKEYYEDGSLKAEWINQNYMKFGNYIEYHRNGQIKMTVNYLDEVNRDGLMYKYYDDGNLKELWSYDKGKRIFVKKYFQSGKLKSEWLYDSKGNEISKRSYSEKN